MYTIKITEEARHELRKEIRYSRKKWGVAHARNYHKELKKQINALKETPLLYAVRDDILPGLRVKTYKGNQIIYIIQEDKKRIVILAILSTYQSLDNNKVTLEQRKTKH